MGTRQALDKAGVSYEDHPHAYGDKSVQFLVQKVQPGSSPRVWGQVHVGGDFRKSLRIIPTRMGTRIVNLCLNYVVKDHPHAYGDKHITKYTI